MELYKQYLQTRQNINRFIKKSRDRIKLLPKRHKQNKLEREIFDILKIQISIANSMRNDVEYVLVMLEGYLPPDKRKFTLRENKKRTNQAQRQFRCLHNPDGDILYPTCNDVDYESVVNPMVIDMNNLIVNNTTPRQRLIIAARYFLNMRQTEIGRCLGISSAGVHKNLALSYEKMKNALFAKGVVGVEGVDAITNVRLEKITVGIEKEFEDVKQWQFKQVSKKIAKKGFQLQSIKHSPVSGQVRYYFKCLKGHDSYIPVLHSGALAGMFYCHECYEKNNTPKYTVEDVKKIFATEGYKALLEDYKDCETPFVCRCDKGHLYKTTLTAFLEHGGRRKRKCPICYQLNTKGYFNKAIAHSKQLEWKQIPAYVYIARLHSECETFYKIGITTNTPEERLVSVPYKTDVLYKIKTNLYNACFLESNLLKYHKKYTYSPSNEFGGQGECFSRLALKLT